MNSWSSRPGSYPLIIKLLLSFYTKAYSEMIILTGPHLRKWEVAIAFSPLSTLHPQVIYAIVFSAGLNGLQVEYKLIQKSINKLLLTHTSLFCMCSVVQVWHHAHTIIAQKAKKSIHENAKQLRGSFLGHHWHILVPISLLLQITNHFTKELGSV